MSVQNTSIPLTTNDHLVRWVEKIAELTKPDAIHWVDGSREEYDMLCAQMVESGTFTKLNQKLWPGCFYARSDPGDVARVEDRTFICSLSKDSAGPTNNWVDPYEMRRKLKSLFDGAMRGRTMYVLGFSMGPVGGPMSRIGVQLTDSPYVVVNMRIMARIGLPVFREIDKDEGRVVPCVHSVGAPLGRGKKMSHGPAIPKNTSFIFRRLAKFGLTARATAETRCSGRNASRCASLRILRAMKAGWPSTC